jgi:hypothetical protein
MRPIEAPGASVGPKFVGLDAGHERRPFLGREPQDGTVVVLAVPNEEAGVRLGDSYAATISAQATDAPFNLLTDLHRNPFMSARARRQGATNRWHLVRFVGVVRDQLR